jgi:cytochrome c biogenesis protein CcdA
MEYLQHLLDNSTAPLWTAIILGLMTAISPCPLATNITAIGFISKDIENRRKIFINGLLYTLGRAVSYTSLGVVLYFGASKFHVARFFQIYGERILGPLLIIVGIVMLDLIKLRLPAFSRFSDKFSNNAKKGSGWSAFLLGIIFALAFCPYSGVLYFGMLIPLSIANPSGLYLPFIFAVATGLPVIIVAWLLAYSLSSIGNFYNKLKTFEKWFRLIIAVLFILAGIYYCYIYYLK